MKLPNRYGAFDMHGNASEWCHNLHSSPAAQADALHQNPPYWFFVSLCVWFYYGRAIHRTEAPIDIVKPPA
jgi:Sulfatase-modifying factor enzyme 1